ncbi:MAG: hypothetical protein J0M33_12485 [Anaerolineae bacterium]|nr:hypothetical protein [Anaerolineae bacterium]
MTGFASGQTQEVFLLNERHAPWLKNERVPLDPGWERFLIIMTIVAAFNILFGLYMLYDNFQIQSIVERLALSGVSIQADVIGQRVGTDNRISHYITYSFQPDPTSDQVYSRESWVSSSYYGNAVLNKVVEVRYLPDNPEVSELVAYPRASRFPVYLIVIMILSGLSLVWVMFRAKARRDRFSNEGQVIRGELLEFKGHMDRSNYLVKTRYRFRSPVGSYIEGKYDSEQNRLKDTVPPASGTPVAVLYVDDKLHRLL